MVLKKILHSTIWRLERLIDGIVGQRDTRRVIEPYIGYATPDHLVVRGRILTTLRRSQLEATQSRWTNFKQMLGLFFTDEVAGVEVSAQGVTALSDEEGYFTLEIPRADQGGWQHIDVAITGREGSVHCPVLIARNDAQFGVISDVDDTMLQTGAYSLVKNLWTSMTGNITTRHIFPDAIRFVDTLAAQGRNPVYYVSSSPWNLHHFLASIFKRTRLTSGPMFLRDLGVSEGQFITGTHGDHKGGSIDTILAANPELRFVLVGDTGQHDAFVYRDALARHPERIVAVVLREPGPGPDAHSTQAMQQISAEGALMLHAPNFEGFAPQILEAVADQPL